mgnify:CR=1 FL=1
MEEQGLLADIREHPDDASLRRIYADWLDDHGDAARAEFIRVQLDLAALGEWDDARPALEKRQAQLLREHEQRWLTGLPPGLSFDFRGGMVESVSGPADRFFEEAAPLSAYPLREVWLERPMPDRVHRSPSGLALLDRLNSCSLRLRLSGSELASLLEDCSFRALREFWLLVDDFPESLYAPLTEHPLARRLERLTLEPIDPGFTSLEPLRAWPEANPLRSFRLTGFQETPAETFQCLIQFPALRCLEELDLEVGYTPGILILQALRSAPFLPRLRRLHLHAMNLMEEEALLRNLPFRDLRHLSFESVVIESVQVGWLPRLPCFAALESLELFGISSSVRYDAFLTTTAPRLTRCELGLPEDPDAARVLARWGAWPSVRSLTLHGVRIPALICFLQEAPLENLRDLRLSTCNLTEFVDFLVRWPGFARLWRFNVDFGSLSDAAARVLLDALPPFIEFIVLNCRSKLSADTLAALRALEASEQFSILNIHDLK